MGVVYMLGSAFFFAEIPDPWAITGSLLVAAGIVAIAATRPRPRRSVAP
jgi:drug/metabolite transporter (DMT)-like permease